MRHRGIILAAGDGSRLGRLTEDCPKVLLPVNGHPLIASVIDAQAAAGITEIAIVVGYLGDRVVEALGDGRRFGVRLYYIRNADYFGGNALSVHRAREWASGALVVVCMGDHLIDRGLIQRLLGGPADHDTLCVDFAPALHQAVEEATKVTIDPAGFITGIGKRLADWDALDTGVFLLTAGFFQILKELVACHGIQVEMGDVIRSIIARGGCFATCDVSGCFWMDVDTEEDLNTVRRIASGL